MISILMPYRRRLPQLRLTLDSYAHWYAGTEYEVIIVEDEVDRTLPDMDRCKIFVSGRNGGNPAPLFNMASRMAESDIFMLTNPECVHMGDLLNAGRHLAEKHEYVCFACRSEEVIPDSFELLLTQERVHGLSANWYQHSKVTNKFFHEAAMISRESYEKVGGFSEEFTGYGYDDHDFTKKLEQASIAMTAVDEPHCVHLPHNRTPFEPTNEALFLQKWGLKPGEF